MQKIFFNGKIFTNNETKEVSSAMLVNDGVVVFSGAEKEVLEMKNDETELIDLEQKFAYPMNFSIKTNVFQTMKNNIKNANKSKNSNKNDNLDENYENFDNFEKYKKEYFKLEKKIIQNGISTISEIGIDKEEFIFWKKMSDENLLSIDVVGYVDLFSSKFVMDDNCVTYRKYRNHFRLGGYYLKIDGKIQELKAWLNKPYKFTKNCGYGECYGEQLYYLVKTALEEKKQVIYETNGDKSIDEVLNIFQELTDKEKITDYYRPVFLYSNIVQKRVYEKLKYFDVTLCFDVSNYNLKLEIKKFIGFRRLKFFQNFYDLIKNDVKFVCFNGLNSIQELVQLFEEYFIKKRKINILLTKKQQKNYNLCEFYAELFYDRLSYLFFDSDTKGGLENQKHASFFVLNKSMFDDDTNVEDVYVLGEKKNTK